MRIINYSSENYQQEMEQLYNRPAYPEEIEVGVKEILNDVKKKGNAALVHYAKKFDNATLTPDMFLVTKNEILAGKKEVSDVRKKAIDQGLKNITAFAKKQIPEPWTFSPRPGVITGERYEPLERVGVYIPGGTAPLVSTIIHTAGIAKAAGVKEIVAITPPGKDGTILPEMLYAMDQAGITEIYRLGGVYGIAALAYGTETIKKVNKIVGPGNAYVTAAKKLVYGHVAIDMVAGPSEIMILADENAPANFIAADMLSQAEHGSGHEQAVLVTPSNELIENVKEELVKQAKLLSRSETIQNVLDNGVFFILIDKMDDAADVATAYAPEHLEIMCKQPSRLAKKVKTAGAIFIGKWTPEPVGDFVAGPSHVLPTAGSAHFFSGVTVETFFRRTSIINYKKHALKEELPTIELFAEMEGLDAHGRSASIRLEEVEK